MSRNYGLPPPWGDGDPPRPANIFRMLFWSVLVWAIIISIGWIIVDW